MDRSAALRSAGARSVCKGRPKSFIAETIAVYAADALDRAVERGRDALLQVLQVGRVLRESDPLRRCVAVPARRLVLVAQLLEVVERGPEEADAVADELHRRVDLVRDPGRGLSDRLESLGDSELALQQLPFRLGAAAEGTQLPRTKCHEDKPERIRMKTR